MKTLRPLILILSLALAASCGIQDPEVDRSAVESWIRGDGVFIVNEGNFMAGNGTLSFYSYSSGKLYNNIFSIANGRPLGDVPNSMAISGDRGYIVVNNSGKIEVVDKNTLLGLRTIDGLVSPRNILFIGNSKAYVSSLYSKSLAIVNIQSNTVTGHIEIRRSSESMIMVGGKVYISSWYNGKDIMVVNAVSDKVTDSIEVAQEPESMVLDKNNKLWVLCSGGYTRQNFAELIAVNTSTDEIEKRFVFPSRLDSPSALNINMTKDTLLFIKEGIYKMSIQATGLPAAAFKQSNGRIIYKLGVDPRNGKIFYTDALDYQSKGYLLQLNPGGSSVDSSMADIIPGSLCFK